MSKPKSVYSLKIGAHRIPFMRVKKSERGDEYVIFPLNPRGFHISAHPGADPHMRDLAGFRQNLDLGILRGVDWTAEAENFREDLEMRAYWPVHRGDILAIPGPRGKSYFKALMELAEEGDLDLLRYLKIALGGGTLYKVGPNERERFFRTKTGQRAFLFDKREGCFAVFAPFVPGRPLLRFGGRFGAIRMHPQLAAWNSGMDENVDLEWEELTPRHKAQLEVAFRRAVPQIEAFVRGLRIVRWRPDRRTGRGLTTMTR